VSGDLVYGLCSLTNGGTIDKTLHLHLGPLFLKP